jgi:hypothetical protein
MSSSFYSAVTSHHQQKIEEAIKKEQRREARIHPMAQEIQPDGSMVDVHHRDDVSLKTASTTGRNTKLTAIRNLAQEIQPDGSFVSVQHRDVTMSLNEARELPGGSRISLAGADATLPMAFDNERFFASEDGYQELFGEAFVKMEKLSKSGEAHSEPISEVGLLQWLWRMFLRIFLYFTNDAVNRLRFSRGLQDNLPFQAGYESFVLGGVVRAMDLDEPGSNWTNLRLGFSNLNASRVLVQNFGSRWDRFWHLSTQITWNRLFDFIGRFPFIGITAFPATENFPSSKNHALRAIFRQFLEGTWFTRSLTSNQQGIVTLDRNTPAQNLAAESTGFEAANRNQFGTMFGRENTNEFRLEHRLPTDESIVRTFMTSPAGTMINNGVEHVLRCLAKHWKNMLYQENGNL